MNEPKFICEICKQPVEDNNISIINTNGFDTIRGHKSCIDSYVKSKKINESNSDSKVTNTTFLAG